MCVTKPASHTVQFFINTRSPSPESPSLFMTMSDLLPNSQDSLGDSLLESSLGPNDSISTLASEQTFGFHNTVISTNNRKRDDFVPVNASSDEAHERLKDNPVYLNLNHLTFRSLKTSVEDTIGMLDLIIGTIFTRDMNFRRRSQWFSASIVATYSIILFLLA